MKKIFLLIGIIFFIFSFQTYAISGDIDVPSKVEEKSGNVDLLMETLQLRKDAIKKIVEEKPLNEVIDSNELKKEENKIQKGIYEEMNNKISEEINSIKKTISENNKLIEIYKNTEKENSENKEKLKKKVIEVKNLKEEVLKKESLIKKNKDIISELELTKERLNSVIAQNIELLKKEKEKEDKILQEKLRILYIGIFIYILFIGLVFLGRKKEIKPTKDSTRFYSNVEVNSTLLFTIFIFIFIFYAFPSLIGILVLGTIGLLMMNSPIVSSFLWSKLVLSRLNIGDNIKYKTGDSVVEGRIKGVSIIGLYTEQLDEYGDSLGIEDFIMHRQALLDRIQKIPKRKLYLIENEIVIHANNAINFIEIIKGIENDIKKFLVKGDDYYLGNKYSFTDSGNIKIVFKTNTKKSNGKDLSNLILESLNIQLKILNEKELVEKNTEK